MFLNHGETFRRTRKFVHQLIGTKTNVSEFSHSREVETRRFLVHMLEKPDDLYEGARMYVQIVSIPGCACHNADTLTCLMSEQLVRSFFVSAMATSSTAPGPTQWLSSHIGLSTTSPWPTNQELFWLILCLYVSRSNKYKRH